MDGNTLLINNLRKGRTMNPDENVFEHILKGNIDHQSVRKKGGH